MNNFTLLEEYFKNEKDKIEKEIFSLQEEVKQLEPLQTVVNQLESDITQINITVLKNILNQFESSEETERDIKILTYIISVQHFIDNPEIFGEAKNQIINLTRFFKSKFQDYYDKRNNEIVIKNSDIIRTLKDKKNKIDKYLSVISDGRIITTLSIEETNELFDELEQSNLNKQIVLELIRDISKFNLEKYKIKIEEKEISQSTVSNDEIKNDLKKDLEKINEILSSNNAVISKYYSLNDSEKNMQSSMYALMVEGGIESVYLLNKDINVSEILFNNSILPRLVELKDAILEELELDYIESEIYELLKMSYEDVSNEYSELIREYGYPFVKKEDDIVLVPEQTLDYDLGNAKNIILMLKNSDGTFCVDKDISRKKGEEEEKNDAVAKSIDTFSSKYYNSEYRLSYNDSEGNHADGKVYYKKSNGKDDYDKKLSPRRLRPNGSNGRVCYISIPICEENKKKLYQIYKNPNLLNEDNGNKLFVFMLTGVTFVNGPDHSGYNDFNKNMNDNVDYIRKIKSLFNNPTAKVEDLVTFIEESKEICNQYLNGESKPMERGR